MSVTTHPETDTCERCDDQFQISHAVEGNYCSAECYHRSKGEGPLSQLVHDHTVCPTCFARLKTVEKPGTHDSVVIGPVKHDSDGANHHASDVLVGYQYPTQNATHAETTIQAGEYSISDTVATTLGCACGATDSTERDETLEQIEGAAVVLNLLRQLHRLYDQGAIDNAPSKDRLFDALREKGRDWEYAIGRCLYA